MHRRTSCATASPRHARRLTPLWRAAASLQPLSIGTTPVFLDDDVAFLRDWQAYLQRELGRPVVFVQRRSYREVSELLLGREARRGMDLRLPVCALSRPHAPACGPDLRRRAAVSLLRDRTQQRSHDAIDRRPRRQDLRLLRSRFELRVARAQFAAVPARQGSGDVLSARPSTLGVIAGSSMPSRSGWPKEARSMGTSGTRSSIHHPELTEQTRVAYRSVKYGFPPFVTRPRCLRAAISSSCRMSWSPCRSNPAGQDLLAQAQSRWLSGRARECLCEHRREHADAAFGLDRCSATSAIATRSRRVSAWSSSLRHWRWPCH